MQVLRNGDTKGTKRGGQACRRVCRRPEMGLQWACGAQATNAWEQGQ